MRKAHGETVRVERSGNCIPHETITVDDKDPPRFNSNKNSNLRKII